MGRRLRYRLNAAFENHNLSLTKADAFLKIPNGYTHFQTLVDQLLEPGLATLPEIDAACGHQTAQLAFQFTMSRCLQQGPGLSPPDHPARLILRAWEAVAARRVPLETPALLRQQLEDAGKKLRHEGLWAATTPLWWEPLPPPAALSQRWFQMAAWGQNVLARIKSQAPHHHNHGHEGQVQTGLWHVPNAIPDTFLQTLFQLLEDPTQKESLGLKRVGVGIEGVISGVRQDEVAYLRGDEWIEPAPLAQLTLLVRWLRTWFGPKLADSLGWVCQVPQNAMLARYAPGSGGYRTHVDNPSGEDDNGRVLTAILYLNPIEKPPRGGALQTWHRDEDPANPSKREFAAFGGDLVCFDSRAYVHQVLPVGSGPARWALSMWFNDRQPPARPASAPGPSATEMFMGIAKPELPANTAVCHHFEGGEPCGRMKPYTAPFQATPRTGAVCTTYRGGPVLRQWCRYHLRLGFDHLILVFDRLSDPQEANLANELSNLHGPERLTCLDGQALRNENWPEAGKFKDRDTLLAMTQFSGHSWSVAARQTLNASHVLTLAKTNRFGGQPLDWLLHLDSDEFFHLEGASRGGGILGDHFALASTHGWAMIRYLNSELLLTLPQSGQAGFKINPRVAIARLGSRGWAALCHSLAMAQNDQRPYFSGYHNGKSAVAVARGRAAAGVHGWYLDARQQTTPVLAGPSILHFHCASEREFIQKYRNKARTPPPSGKGLFPPSPLEQAAMAAMNPKTPSDAQTGSNDQLAAVYRTRTHFKKDHVKLLKMAGLVVSPEIPELDGLANLQDA